MRAEHLWLDLSKPKLRVWMGPTLQLAQARGSSQQRVGFYKEIPLYHLPESSALPMGWTSFAWQDTLGKFAFDENFWVGLEAARFSIFSVPNENTPLLPPLGIDFPLASDVMFFAGTFDPWHEGHRACLELAPKDFPLIICPDRNPHKPVRSDDQLERYLALEKILPLQEGMHVYPGFLLKEGVNPTVNWVLRVKRNRPDLRLHLLMGHDSFASLSSWTQASELVKLLSGLQVVSRGESDEQRMAALDWVTAQDPQLKVKFLGHHSFENVSSTGLRLK